MRLMHLSAVNPGDKLSYPIRTQNGQILLPANTELTYNYLRRLASFGINSVYVQDDIFKEVVISPCMSDETKTAAIRAVESAYKALGDKKYIDSGKIKHASKGIVEDIKHSSKKEPIGLFDTYAVNDNRFLHAVNVATITAAIAMEHGCEPAIVEDYVTAAMLHDIHLSDMSQDGDVTHAETAKEYLKFLRDYSVRTYMSVGMHHERFDGTGKDKIAGQKIAEGARILAVADVYDSLLHGYGNYKANGLNFALEQLNSLSGKAIDPDFLNYFNSSVAIYPVGSTVLLNNKINAVVVAQNYKMPARPKVRLAMPNKADCIEINLLTNLTSFIEKVL